MLVGCDNTNEDKLIDALQRKSTYDGLDFTQVYPYNGTPTGEALEEAYDYLKHENDNNNSDNSTFVTVSTKNSLQDPYWSPDAVRPGSPDRLNVSCILLLIAA